MLLKSPPALSPNLDKLRRFDILFSLPMVQQKSIPQYLMFNMFIQFHWKLSFEVSQTLLRPKRKPNRPSRKPRTMFTTRLHLQRATMVSNVSNQVCQVVRECDCAGAESNCGNFWPQDFEVEVVEEETDLPKRSISGIGYEAYGDSAHIEYFSATHNKWLLGKHGVRCQMILPAFRSSLGMFGMRPMRFPTVALPERLQGCIQGTGSLVEDGKTMIPVYTIVLFGGAHKQVRDFVAWSAIDRTYRTATNSRFMTDWLCILIPLQKQTFSIVFWLPRAVLAVQSVTCGA